MAVMIIPFSDSVTVGYNGLRLLTRLLLNIIKMLVLLPMIKIKIFRVIRSKLYILISA